MLKIDCDVCAKELKEPGALLFTPPECPSNWTYPKCIKLHICVSCCNRIINYMAKMEAPKTRRKNVKRKRK